jgi:hypothetical protein
MTNRDRVLPNWFVLFLVSAAACLGLVSPAPLLAAETTDLSPGQWVRVTTGTEVAGEGFAMSLHETQGYVVSRDHRTMTFDVSGQETRVAKPRTTLEGEVQAFDDKVLVLGGSGEARPVLVPRDALTRVDVRLRHSSKWRGLAVGAGAGLAGAVLAGVLSGSDECAPIFKNLCFSASDKAAIYSVVAVPIGALLGLAVAPGARWQSNSAVDRVHLSLRRTRSRGIEVSLLLAF